MRLALVCGVAYVIVCIFTSKSVANEKKTKTEKIGKKVTDYNDIDVEKLLDQWNENDDDYEDEDDEVRRKKPPGAGIDMQKVFAAGGNKEDIMKISKKGQPLMMFVNVAGNPTKSQTETVSSFWQTSLRNNNIQVQRYIVGDKRVLLQLEDGSQAFEIKDYLVSLDTCESVSFENLEFPGKGKGRTKLEL